MLKDITFGQYYPADSFVHKMDPRSKLILSLYGVRVFRGQFFPVCVYCIAAVSDDNIFKAAGKNRFQDGKAGADTCYDHGVAQSVFCAVGGSALGMVDNKADFWRRDIQSEDGPQVIVHRDGSVHTHPHNYSSASYRRAGETAFTA